MTESHAIMGAEEEFAGSAEYPLRWDCPCVYYQPDAVRRTVERNAEPRESGIMVPPCLLESNGAKLAHLSTLCTQDQQGRRTLRDEGVPFTSSREFEAQIQGRPTESAKEQDTRYLN